VVVNGLEAPTARDREREGCASATGGDDGMRLAAGAEGARLDIKGQHLQAADYYV